MFYNLFAQEGELFGENSFLTGKPHHFSCKTIEFTSIFAISHEKFVEIMRENNEDYESYCMIKDSIALNNKGVLNLTCFSCESKNHTINHCPLIHYEPDKEKIIKKYDFYKEQERLFVIRRKKRRSPYILNLNAASKFKRALSSEKKAIISSNIRKNQMINQYMNPFERFNSSDIDNNLSESEIVTNVTTDNLKNEVIEEEFGKEIKSPPILIRNIKNEVIEEEFVKEIKSPTILRRNMKVSKMSLEAFEEDEKFPEKKMKTNDTFNKITSKSYAEKIANAESQKYFFLNFEKIQDYSKYFPQFNCQKILKLYEFKRKRMKIYKNFKNLTIELQNEDLNSCFQAKLEEKVKIFGKYSFNVSEYKNLILNDYEKKRQPQLQLQHITNISTKKMHSKGNSPEILGIKKKGIMFFNDNQFNLKKTSFPELVATLIKERKQNNKKTLKIKKNKKMSGLV